LYGLARRVAVPGERGDFFEMTPDAFNRAHGQLGTARVIREPMEMGLASLDNADSPRTEQVRETRHLRAFRTRELPLLMDRFRTEYWAAAAQRLAARHESEASGHDGAHAGP